MLLSAIIPYKPDHGPRDRIWSIVQERYRRLFPEIEVCLGVDESEPFCRSRAINLAAAIATGDVFILTDTDVVFNRSLINGIRNWAQQKCWFIPFVNGVRLNQKATQRLLNHGLPEQIRVTKEDIVFIERKPGTHMNVVTRQVFRSIGGLDERFQGWGYEDTALVVTLDTLYGKHQRLGEELFHLWHPPAPIIPDKYQANQRLWERYHSADGRVLQMRLLIQERLSQ